MASDTLEGRLTDFGYEHADHPAVQLIRSKTPLKVGDTVPYEIRDPFASFFNFIDVSVDYPYPDTGVLPRRKILGLLPKNNKTYNHVGEGPYVGIAWTREYAQQRDVDALNGYNHTVHLRKDVGKGIRFVTLSYIKEDNPKAVKARKSLIKTLSEREVAHLSSPYEPDVNLAEVNLICAFPNDEQFRFNERGLFTADGTPFDKAAKKIEKELFN